MKALKELRLVLYLCKEKQIPWNPNVVIGWWSWREKKLGVDHLLMLIKLKCTLEYKQQQYYLFTT